MAQKIALITGSATRLGKGIALHLARQGWQIVIHYNKSKKEAEELSAEINMISKSLAVKLDLYKLTGFDKLFQQIISGLGVPTLLVNNAAVFSGDNIYTTSRHKLETHMRVNCFAPILLAQKFIEANKSAHSAHIINVLDSSINFDNSKSFLSYSLSKSCLSQATKLLSAQSPSNICVSSISPGFVMPSKGQSKKDFEMRAGNSRVWSLAEICEAIDLLLCH